MISATLILPADFESLPLDAAATAVVVGSGPNDTTTYWALEHLGERPDFHLRGSLTLRL